MKILLFLFLISTSAVFSQVSENSELYKQLKQNDSLLFDVGFNTCSLAAFEHLLFDDLEFYHDQGGVTSSKEGFVKDFNKNICGSANTTYRRELTENSLKVFPLFENGKLYGALQQGEHSFFSKKENETEVKTGTAKFTHVWLKDGELWRLKRVLSYDHQGI